MRPVSGFERPAVQWLFVGLAVLLVAIGATVSLALWRTRGEIEALRAANLQARADRQAVEAQLARETAAREALRLELGRQGGRPAADPAPPPTLTIEPIRTRGREAPPPTVAAPGATLLIELRLMLPAGTRVPGGPFTVTLRERAGGDALWVRAGLPGGSVDGRPAISALIAGDVLPAGSYEFTVSSGDLAAGPSLVASYELTVGPAPTPREAR